MSVELGSHSCGTVLAAARLLAIVFSRLLSLLLGPRLRATACCHRRLLGFCRQTLQNHPAAAAIAAIGMPQADANARFWHGSHVLEAVVSKLHVIDMP